MIAHRDLPTEFPGALGIGFVRKVPNSEPSLHAFIEASKKDGAPLFEIRTPPTSSPVDVSKVSHRFVIQYAEPANRNLAAIGLDIGADLVRREAAERAERSGEATLTRRIHLVQAKEVAPGFLYLLPVYRDGRPIATEEERKAATIGWVYMPIFSRAIFEGVRDNIDEQLDFEVYDGDTSDYARLIYDNDGHISEAPATTPSSPNADNRRFSEFHRLALGGQTWGITTSTTPSFEHESMSSARVILWSGSLLSVLLSVFVWLLASEKKRVYRLAQHMTTQVRRESERANLALSGGGLGFWDWDLEHQHVAYDDRWAEMIGETTSTLAPHPDAWSARIHPEDRARTEVILQQHFRRETQAYEAQFRLRHRDGSWRSILAKGKVFEWSSDGRPLRMVGTHLDVSKETETRAQLARQVDAAEHAARLARVGTWEMEVANGVVTWSKEVFRIFDMPEEADFSLHRCFSLFSGEDVQRISQAVETCRSVGTSWDLELSGRTASGRMLSLRWIGEPVYDGAAVIKLRGALQDTTEQTSARHSLEAALQEARTFRNALDQNYIFSVTDVSGKILDVNDAFCKSSGYSAEELIGKDHSWLSSGQHPRSFWQEAWQVISENRAWRGEVCNRHKNGSFYWVDTTIIPFTHRDGSISHYVAIRVDITQRKQIEADLVEANEAATRASRSKSEFLANMSHEIRTPMNGVVGMTDLLLETKLTLEQIELATTVKESAETLLTVINDILDFSKVEAGKLELASSVFELRPLLQRIEAMVGHKTRAKRLSYILEFAPEVPRMIEGDSHRLSQVLLNLVGNAVKFTSEQGAIVVRVALEREESDRFLVLFAVTDTGIGISPEHQHRIFEAFAQADSSIAHRFGGTGLGLSISSKLVQLMGGRLNVVSEPGRGSTFSFTLPFRRPSQTIEESGTAQTSAASSAQIPPALRVLLAEDNVVNQRVALGILERAGHTVILATNGAEAIQLFEQHPIDLILMDMQMPVMGGEEATSHLRRRERGRHIPIIALTAHAIAGDRERYLQAGLTDYVSKPINRGELFGAIARALKPGQER